MGRAGLGAGGSGGESVQTPGLGRPRGRTPGLVGPVPPAFRWASSCRSGQPEGPQAWSHPRTLPSQQHSPSALQNEVFIFHKNLDDKTSMLLL